MVAPMSVSVPFSTCGSSASCCALLKRWISSTKRMVRFRCSFQRSCAPATVSRMSFTPERTADSDTKAAPVARATIRASVVLPVPGGPQRMSEGTWSASMARRRKRPSPVTCSWPTNSAERAGAHALGQGRLAGLVLLAGMFEEVHEA